MTKNSNENQSSATQASQDQVQNVVNLKKEKSDENQNLQATVKKEGKLKKDTQITKEKMEPETI